MEIIKDGNMNRPYASYLGKCGFCACEFRCVWQECDYNVPHDPKLPVYWTRKCPTCSRLVHMREEKK